MLFSGSFLPLDTLSNMDDQIPFAGSSLLFGLPSVATCDAVEPRVDVLGFIITCEGNCMLSGYFELAT